MIGLQDRGDEFYIGYEPLMPEGIARRIRLAVVAALAAAAGAAAIVLGAQGTLPPSRFEFGVVREVHGVLRRQPYPTLDVDGRRLWLAGPGKLGVERVLGSTPDGPVRLAGSLVERGDRQLLEVKTVLATNPSTQSPGHALPAADTTGRTVTLQGEIVDSKCFLGVMNPGEGTVHRDCATRCLAGGLTPTLVVRDGHGREALVVLVSRGGRPVGRALARLAGQPVVVTGRLTRDGGDYVLFANPEDFSRRR